MYCILFVNYKKFHNTSVLYYILNTLVYNCMIMYIKSAYGPILFLTYVIVSKKHKRKSQNSVKCVGMYWYVTYVCVGRGGDK